MDASGRDSAARWLADSVQSGAPLSPLPAEATPRSLLDGQRVAARVIEALGVTPNGLRLAPGPGGKSVAGPVLEDRVLPDGTTVPMASLRHPRVAPAIVGVLAEELSRRGDGLPDFTALHPAIDIATWRLRDAPTTCALAAADLGGLGLLVLGRPRKPEVGELRVTLSAPSAWKRGQDVELEEPLYAAALAARRAGGLPQGSLLVAVLGTGVAPDPGAEIVASFGKLGKVTVRFG